MWIIMWITYTTYQHYQQLDIRGLRFEDGLNWVIHRLGGLSTSYAHRFGSYPQRVNLRSEEHTSELQSLRHLVCRLLLEKKKKDENVLNLLRQPCRRVSEL